MTYPTIDVLDMHTGGEPLRIVRHGYPEILGSTILEKRKFAKENLDHLRKFLMFEPRGHADMYGAVLVEPTHPEAHFGVLFMHNEGYSTMCGHAIIALGRYAVDYSLVPITEPETHVNIECPCGLICAKVQVISGKSGRVSFLSVPAFLHSSNLTATINNITIRYDIAYGGAFYAIADASQFNLSLETSSLRDLVDAATSLTDAAKAIPLSHPDHPELAFLYGTILTDGNETGPSKNICVFADAEVDRSPTGSGVTARMALRHAKSLGTPLEVNTFQSVTDAEFTAQVVQTAKLKEIDTVIVEVSGQAFYSGETRFGLEELDEIGKGFRLGM